MTYHQVNFRGYCHQLQDLFKKFHRCTDIESSPDGHLPTTSGQGQSLENNSNTSRSENSSKIQPKRSNEKIPYYKSILDISE